MSLVDLHNTEKYVAGPIGIFVLTIVTDISRSGGTGRCVYAADWRRIVSAWGVRLVRANTHKDTEYGDQVLQSSQKPCDFAQTNSGDAPPPSLREVCGAVGSRSPEVDQISTRSDDGHSG